MATYPNFDTSNSSELDFLQQFDFIPISEQRQNGNRNNVPATTSSLISSANLTSQTSHNFYQSMLPTPEGSGSDNNAVCPETLILSPYNILPGSGHLTIEEHYKDDDFFLESPESGVSFITNNYIPAGLLSPQTSPTLPPDVSMNITNSPTRRQSQERRFSPISKHKKSSSNNKNSASQPIRKSPFTNGNNSNNNKNNGNSNNDANGQNNAITNLPSIMTAPSLQDTMPNLNLGSNLVSDVTNTHSSTRIESSSSDKIAPITPSSLMKMQKKPNSPKSDQDGIKSNSQQLKQDQSQQLSKDTFIAPIPPNQIRTNVVATTSAAPLSGASGRKPIRSAPSPLALGPKSPHSLKPTISPNLKPKLPGVLANEVAEQLANKSNYRSILDGSAQSLGISYPSDVHSSLESRRTTHKAAEQKRRDSLKQSFDELKKVVPYQSALNKNNNGDGDTNNNSKSNSNGKSGDGTMKNVSKLFLLKRAHDHIVELEQKSKEKDEIIQKLKDELDELKRVKRQKIEKTEKKENGDEVDTETKQQASSNEC